MIAQSIWRSSDNRKLLEAKHLVTLGFKFLKSLVHKVVVLIF